jgi:putative PIN family toxin of toxin-antitoxin system
VRAVVDTTVLISALWSPRGAPAQILAAYRAGRFSLVTSEPILKELAAVLRREHIRQRVPAAQRNLLRDLVRRGAERVEIPETLHLCSDPKDDKFIETALAGGVDLLVSGDKHLQEAAVVAHLAEAQIEVIRPAGFLRALQLLQPLQAGDLFTDWNIEP